MCSRDDGVWISSDCGACVLTGWVSTDWVGLEKRGVRSDVGFRATVFLDFAGDEVIRAGCYHMGVDGVHGRGGSADLQCAYVLRL